MFSDNKRTSIVKLSYISKNYLNFFIETSVYQKVPRDEFKYILKNILLFYQDNNERIVKRKKKSDSCKTEKEEMIFEKEN